MDFAPEIATTLHVWLQRFCATPPAAAICEVAPPEDSSVTVPALAALAAEALARDRSLWIVTADDTLLPDLSNALDLRLRPLCLVLPGAEYAGRIALRATLSLLKSRLARAAEDSDGPAWIAMRERLAIDNLLWREALAWSGRGLDSEAPPADIAALYPVRIGPWSIASRLVAPTDWVMLTQAAQLPAAARTAWPSASRTLMLGAGGRLDGGCTALAWIDQPAQLRAELEVLGQELAEMELELATAQGELSAFGNRYQDLITGRMAELDRLKADLAQLRLQQAPQNPAVARAAQQAETRTAESQREYEKFRAGRATAGGAFRPGNDIKKRFRQLAQKIHPDRAKDEDERAWRTQLMSEANRAYRADNVAALDEILALWQEGRTPDVGADSAAPTSTQTEALNAQVTGIRHRITAIAAELDRLYGSKLYELFAAARVAARQGRDLLEEMVARIDAQIAQAQVLLDNFGPQA